MSRKTSFAISIAILALNIAPGSAQTAAFTHHGNLDFRPTAPAISNWGSMTSRRRNRGRHAFGRHSQCGRTVQPGRQPVPGQSGIR